MNDTRALAWTSLFPSGTSYVALGGPSWFREPLEGLRGAGRQPVLVAWDRRAAAFRDLDLAGFSGVVAINCPGLSAGDFEDAGLPYLRRFAVVPSLAAARWFIPLDTPAISAAAFQLYTPFQLSARLKQSGIRAVARSGLPFWYRDQVWIAQRDASPLELTLQTLVPAATRLAFSTGTPGPARKPTAALLAADGHVVGYAKLSCSDLTSRLVRHEADVLRALATLPGQEPLAPRLLFAGEVEGMHVTVQTVLAGRPPSRTLSPAHRQLLASLSVGPTRLASQSGIVRSLRGRIASLTSPRSDLLAALDGALTVLDGLALPTTIVHGDFAPWNLRVSDGAVAAFDWEYAELDGLPLLDEIQHHLQVGFFLDDWPVDRAHDRMMALASSAPLGLRPEQVRALQTLSLLALLARALLRLDDGFDSNRWLIARCRRLLGLLSDPVREAVA